MRWHLIAYDISRTGARDAISRRLEKKGRRVQKSVFMVDLAPQAMAGLEQELQECLEEGDSLLILPLCLHCLESSRYLGELPPDLEIW